MGGADNLIEEDLAREEESEEINAARKIVQPRQPTAAERREHDKTHCPYRSWCEHCVRSQGSLPQRKRAFRASYWITAFSLRMPADLLMSTKIPWKQPQA